VAGAIGSVATACVFAVLLCLVLGSWGRVAWPLDLFSNFQLQYFVLFVLLTIVLMIVGRARAIYASLLCTILASLPLFSYMSFPGRTAEASPARFRLVTFNVWYRNEQAQAIARYLESTAADMIVLEELTDEHRRALEPLLRATYPHMTVEPGELGVAIFSKWPIASSRSVPLSAEANGGLVTVAWQGQRVSLLGVHLHWPLGWYSAPLREQELRSIASFAASFGEPLLVAGDMNLTPWSPNFERLLKDSGLVDSAVGEGLTPSWPSQFLPAGIRIDHCLMSRHWRSVEVGVGPDVHSDHRPLQVDLQLTEPARPAG
jgi:endonuclease/exonuclease/phosphatase (EEP) superfamily protein YafD